MSSINEILTSITDECRSLNIDDEHIECGHKHAQNVFRACL